MSPSITEYIILERSCGGPHRVDTIWATGVDTLFAEMQARGWTSSRYSAYARVEMRRAPWNHQYPTWTDTEPTFPGPHDYDYITKG